MGFGRSSSRRGAKAVLVVVENGAVSAIDDGTLVREGGDEKEGDSWRELNEIGGRGCFLKKLSLDV